MPKTHKKHPKSHRKHPKSHKNKSNKKYGGIFGFNLIPTSMKFGKSKVEDIERKIGIIKEKITTENTEHNAKIEKLKEESNKLITEYNRIKSVKGLTGNPAAPVPVPNQI